MSKICSKCGKEFEDTELRCPNCGAEFNFEKALEVPNIESITPVSEEIDDEEIISVVEEIPQSTIEPAPTISEVTPVVETLPEVEEIQSQSLPVVEAEMPIIEAPKLDDIVSVSLEEQANDDSSNDNIIENASLETVSIEATDTILETKEEVFEIPEMPEPMIGEINPDILGNKYDTEEKMHNDRLEAKKKLEEEEIERKRLEAEAKNQIPVEKPDLLARIPDSDEGNIDLKPTKKKGKPMRKLMNVIIVILGIAVIAAAAWYFLLQDKEKADENSYMDPIDNYFAGYKEADSTKMLSSFVPCVSKTDEITSLITATVQSRNQYSQVTIEYKEKTAEVVNKDDQKHLDDYLSTTCPTNTPKIEDYKHVYIEQKIKTEQDKEYTQNNPEFWTVKIDNEWYILLVQ